MRRIAAVVLLFAAPVAARAHPHIWIDADVTFQFTGHTISHLEVEWRFDPFFTEMIVVDFDVNRDRRIDAEESRQIHDHAFTNLRHFGYFLDIRVNGQRRDVVPDMVRSFRASLENDQVVYRFHVHLEVPVSTRETRVTVAMYDETYFTEIMMAEEPPAHIRGEPPNVETRLTTETRMDRVWYFVNIPTQEVVLRARRTS